LLFGLFGFFVASASVPLRLSANGALRQRREATLLPSEAVGLASFFISHDDS